VPEQVRRERSAGEGDEEQEDDEADARESELVAAKPDPDKLPVAARLDGDNTAARRGAEQPAGADRGAMIAPEAVDPVDAGAHTASRSPYNNIFAMGYWTPVPVKS
jgi:hypothetical protein